MPAGREVGVVGVQHQVFHLGLQLGVHGGLDGKAAGVQHLLGVRLRDALLGHDVLHHFLEQCIGEVGGHGGVLLVAVVLRQRQRLGGGVAVVLLADDPLLPHVVHDEVSAVDQVLRVGVGVVVGGVLGDGSDGGTLPQGQLADVLVEVLVGRRLNALDGAGEADGVQVRLQDGLLGVAAAQAERTVDLAQLTQSALDAAGAVVIGQVLDELLLQRGSTLLGAVDGQQILIDHGTNGAFEVDARLVVEILVLGADECILQVGGDLLQVGPHAVAVGGAQGGILHLCTGVRIVGHDHAGLAQLDVVQVQQVAVVGRGLHHIEHHTHGQQAAGHDAQAQQGGNGAADEPQDRVLCLFLRFLRSLSGFPDRLLPAALAHIYLTSRRRLRRTAFAAPVDLSHLIAGDRDRLLTHTGKLQRTQRCDLPFKNRWSPSIRYHIIARRPDAGKDQSSAAGPVSHSIMVSIPHPARQSTAFHRKK